VSTSASGAATLSAGAQLLLNDGFLPSNLSTSQLAQATPSQLDAMASATMQAANVDTLFGIAANTGVSSLFGGVSSSESPDSVILSDQAAALLGQTAANPADPNAPDPSSALLSLI
jgi:hypothetical protein